MNNRQAKKIMRRLYAESRKRRGIPSQKYVGYTTPYRRTTFVGLYGECDAQKESKHGRHVRELQYKMFLKEYAVK